MGGRDELVGSTPEELDDLLSGEHDDEMEDEEGNYTTPHIKMDEHRDYVKTPAEKSKQASFESLNYDFFRNRLYWQRRVLLTKRYFSLRSFLLWFVSIMIGLCVGLIAFFIDFSVRNLMTVKFTQTMFVMEKSYYVGLSVYIAFSVGMAAVATLLVNFVEPVAAGSGIPEVKCYLNGVRVPNLVRMKTLIAKSVGILFSVASGLPVGKEGPMIHVGATVGGGLSQGRSVTLKWAPSSHHIWKMFCNDKDKRDFISIGAAAGVAAAFGAPIGGVLFSLEEGASHWNQQLTWMSFAAAMTATFTLNVFLSGTLPAPINVPQDQAGWGKLTFPSITDFGTFAGHYGYDIFDIPFFIVVGIGGGLLGALFNHINKHLTLWRMKYIPASNRFRRITEVLLVTTSCAVVNYTLPYFLTYCRTIQKEVLASYSSDTYIRYYCRAGEYNEVATLSLTPPSEAIKHLFHQVGDIHSQSHYMQFSFQTLLVYFVFLFCLAVWTYGIAVPSGLFVPSLFCGAVYGRIAGESFRSLGFACDPGVYALVGAASLLGGMARMTISLCAILIESTNGIRFGLPLMISLMMAKWSGDFFNHGLYDIHIDLKQVPMLEWAPSNDADLLSAADIMASNVIVLPEVVQVRRVLQVLESCSHSGFPVVPDQGRAPELRGLILRDELAVIMDARAFQREKTAPGAEATSLRAANFEDPYPRFPKVADMTFATEELDMWMDLSPVMNCCPHVIQEWAPVSRAYSLFRTMGLRHLLVVGKQFQVQGIITRKDLTHNILSEILLSHPNLRSSRTGSLFFNVAQPSTA